MAQPPLPPSSALSSSSDDQQRYAPPPTLPAAHTFPSATSTTPFWASPPHALSTHRSTPTLPSTTDILIIGAGLTGVSLAYHLLRSSFPASASSASSASLAPSSSATATVATSAVNPTEKGSILLLEARQLSSGATARNGGHLKPPPWHATHVAETYGAGAAAELVAFQAAHIGALKEAVEREGLAGAWSSASGSGGGSELLVSRSWDVFVDQDMWERRRDGMRALQALEGTGTGGEGEAELGRLARELFQVLDGKEWGTGVVEGITGVRGAVGAFGVPVASVWPYRLVCGLYERIQGEVSLQTETKVVGVSEQRDAEGYWVVGTERGDVRARTVVFATNAYTAGVLNGYEGVIVPVKGTACKVDRKIKDDRSAAQRRTYTYNIFKEDGQVDYLIHRPDGGAIVGGATETFKPDLPSWAGVVDDSTLLAEDRTREYFERRMETAWRDWEESGTEIDKIWTGIMGITADGYPHVGAVPGKENQYICAGFNGAGMPHIFLSTKGLARMIRDGAAFEDVGIPRIFKVSEERIKAPWAKDKFTAPKGFR